MGIQMNIVLIDSNQNHRELIIAQLVEIYDKYSIEGLSTIEEGIKGIKSGLYNLIVLQSEKNCIENLKTFKKLRNNGFFIPLILISSNPTQELLIEGINAGISRFIRKNSNQNDFIKNLHNQIVDVLQENKSFKTRLNINFKSIIHNLDSGVLISDRNQKVVYINEKFSEYSGLKPEEVIGKYSYEIGDIPNNEQNEIQIKKSINGLKI